LKFYKSKIEFFINIALPTVMSECMDIYQIIENGNDLEIVKKQVRGFGGKTTLKHVVEALGKPLVFETVQFNNGFGRITAQRMAKIMTYKGCTVYQRQDGLFYIHGIKCFECGEDITLDEMFD
jgi:hypothetical protein